MKPNLALFILLGAAALASPQGSAALDVEEVQVLVETSRSDESPNECLLFFVSIIADTSLQGGTFTPPAPAPAVPIAIDSCSPADPGKIECEFIDLGPDPGPCFSSLTQLQDSYPSGTYSFFFDGGAETDTDALAWAPDEPDCFVDVTFPADLSTIDWTIRAFQWTLPGGCSADSQELSLRDLTALTEIEEDLGAPASSTWIAPELVPGHQYGFSPGLSNSVTSDELTDGKDDYSYENSYGNSTDVVFDVTAGNIPTTGVWGLVVAGSITLAYGRRRLRARDTRPSPANRPR